MGPGEDHDAMGTLDMNELARVVSNVTRTMCGVSFVVGEGADRGESICSRMLVLPLIGLRRINIVMSCDTATARNLAASLLRRPAQQVGRAEVDAALRELLSMVGGQVVNVMQVDQTLGAIRAITLADLVAEGAGGFGGSALLRGSDSADLRIWVYEVLGDPDTDADESGPQSFGSRGASLVRRLLRR
jgi:CheY-specific phosphatase CheX